MVILIAAVTLNCDIAVAQDHFIGEDRAVNRVIQLRSEDDLTTLDPSLHQTSRVNQIARQGSSADPVPKIEFDEISVAEQAQESKYVPKVSSYWDAAKPYTRSDHRDVEQNLFSVKKSSSLVVTEIKSPKFVNVNQTARFVIKLRNQGMDAVENVRLIASLPAHTLLDSASPTPSHSDGQRFEFSVPGIEAKGVVEVSLDLVPTEKKPFEIATHVVVENQQQTSVSVRQPILSMELSGPRQANIGQIVTHELIITNEGDGIATDVNLETLFPAELEVLQQSTAPVIAAIEPGKSIRVAYQSQAIVPGPVQLRINATADGDQTQQCALDFRVYQPELRISAVGPKLNYVNRDGIYTISIDNTGEVDVTNIQLSLAVPGGMKVTTISREAKVDGERGILTWSYPKISANTKERIQLKATAINEGMQVCNLEVSSNETPAKDIKLTTQVVTRADLSVRIKNLTGPVQVGGKAEFLVEVENQGSRSANKVNVNIALPESLMPVNDHKVSVEQAENGIAFVEPVVQPGQKVSFKFTTVGVVEGEHVVRSILQADGSLRQVISEDTVLVYEVDEARVSESLSGEVRR